MSGYDFMSRGTQAMQDDDSANPAMLSVLDGEALWNAADGATSKSCADCHGDARLSMKGVAARYPAIDRAGSRPVEHIASAPRQVYDVTGAGDTVLATVSLAISAGASYRDAMELAAEAAAIAVSTMGTATVKLNELESALNVAVQPSAGAVR